MIRQFQVLTLDSQNKLENQTLKQKSKKMVLRLSGQLSLEIEPVSFQNTLISVISFDLYDPVLYKKAK